jgi:hypothetical protein
VTTNSVLNTLRRQTVLFDAANLEHRRWAHRFVKERNWQGCPYTFALPNSEPNVYTMVTRLLTEYYGDQEFAVGAKVKPKPSLRAVL